MTRHIILLLTVFILISGSSSGNEIDDVKTEKEVLKFVRRFFPDLKTKGPFDKYYDETIKIADSLKVRTWVKTDIDNNGETDLVVFLADGLPKIFAIISSNGNFKKVIANYDCKYQYIYPLVVNADNKNVILLYHQSLKDYDDESKRFIYTKMQCDTLTVVNNLFVNYIKKPRVYDVEKIEIVNDGLCEGDCPKINISIDAKTFSNTCIKKSNWDINPKDSIGTLNADRIKNILLLLQHSNFSDLEERYAIRCTDWTTTILTITYDNGKTKRIEDYGSSGNFTLTEIYNIAYSVQWTAAK